MNSRLKKQLISLTFLLSIQLGLAQKEILQLGHVGQFWALELSPDQTQAATSGEDGRVLVWDLNVRSLLYRFETYGNRIEEVAFHPKGNLLAAIDVAGNLFLWDLKTGETKDQYRLTKNGFTLLSKSKTEDLAFSNIENKGGELVFINNQLLIGTKTDNFTDLLSNLHSILFEAQQCTAHPKIVNQQTNDLENIREIIDLTKNLCLLHVGSLTTEDQLILFDIKTKKIRKTIWKSKRKIESIALSPDGLKLAISMESSFKKGSTGIEIIEVETGKKLRNLEYNGKVTWQSNRTFQILSSRELIKYDGITKRIENKTNLNASYNDLVYLKKTNEFLLANSSRGLTLYSPSKLELKDQFKLLHPKEFDRSYITSTHFLDSSRILVEWIKQKDFLPTHDRVVRNISTRTTDNPLPFGKRYVLGFDPKSNIFRDHSQLFKNENGKLIPYLKFRDNCIGFQPHDQLIITLKKKSDTAYLNVIDYMAMDTLTTIKTIQNYDYESSGFYETNSGNLAVYSETSGRGKLDFYNSREDYNEPFKTVIKERLQISAFDGQKLILTKSQNSSGTIDKEIYNLAAPNHILNVDISTYNTASFHPKKPLIFYSKYFDNQIVCYNYATKEEVASYGFNENRSKKAQLRPTRITVNPQGSLVSIVLENNEIHILKSSNFTQKKSFPQSARTTLDIQVLDDLLIFKQLFGPTYLYDLKSLRLIKELKPLPHSGQNQFFAIQKNQNSLVYCYIKNYKKSVTKPDNYFIHKVDENFINGEKQKDSFNVNGLSITKKDLPFRLFDNRYLLLINKVDYAGQNRQYWGSKIFDLKKMELLVEADFSFDKLITTPKKVLFFISNKLTEWEKGSNSFKYHNLENTNDYFGYQFLPQIGWGYLSNSNQLLKSEIDHLEFHDFGSKKALNRIDVPSKYSRISLLEPTDDETVWISAYSTKEQGYFLQKFNPSNLSWTNVKIPIISRPIILSKNGQVLVLMLENGNIELRNPESGELLTQLSILEDGNLYAFNNEGYYFSTSSAKNPFYTTYEGKSNSDFSKDLSQNRPDLVLSSINMIDPKLLDLYASASKKRKLFFYGLSTTELDKQIDFEITGLPENFRTTSNQIILDINFKTPSSTKEIRIRVNGQTLRPQDFILSPNKVKIPLVKGENQLEIGSLHKGSLYKRFNVFSTSSVDKKALFVVPVSVSKYVDSTKNLSYATKDGIDIIELFKTQRQGYDTIVVKNLFDSNVTKKGIDNLFSQLEVNINDVVIFFFSGHGLLDEKNNFFFATHDIDFNNPELKGYSWENLQRQIKQVPAQKKLLLIDACHSGLADNDNSAQDLGKPVQKPSNSVKITKETDFSLKGSRVQGGTDSKANLSNSFLLMQELFGSFTSDSGTETITAASGDSWALESSRWKNGAFTFALKKGLIDYEADEDYNGQITITELKKYLIHEVEKLTNGAQKPTSRESNPYLNWIIWE